MPSSPARRRQARKERRTKPPRPLNAFFLFREDFRKRNGDLRQQEVSKKASEAWRLLPANERQRYKRLAERQANFHENTPLYNQNTLNDGNSNNRTTNYGAQTYFSYGVPNEIEFIVEEPNSSQSSSPSSNQTP
ncbi:9707_t:CDS:1 [Paraglomus brasilianum]|uniref:9707_t:CDS:1 n=1 Tax=Paraglomus brasilianum TaxID=144538 RepID=A0A9N8ZUC5_9GLOM|nr:9707_t:CDS:1 [Paraglomus brasilianum]